MTTINAIKPIRNVVVVRKTSLTQSEKEFIQTHLDLSWSLDVIKGAYPDRISCSMRTL